MQLGNLHMPGQIGALVNYFTNTSFLYELFSSLLIFLVFWGFRRLFTNYIFHFILKLVHRSKMNPEESVLVVLRDPVRHWLVLFGAYLALQNLLPIGLKPVLSALFRSGVIVLFAGAVCALIEYYSDIAKQTQRIFTYEVDKILIPFFSKVVRVIALALAFVAVASTWGYDVNGFIAGLGLGGLAFALAAKDLLANIFSGIIIITDKTFSIGDWVKSGEVEGTIEEINFRSTKLRAFDNALITVPNSSLVNAPIVNFTKRSRRRVNFQLRVTYDTPDHKLKACIASIERLLRSHPEVAQETLFVKFDSFGNSSLEIFLYFFTKTIVWEQYLNVKQEINFAIMRILEENGVRLALPSTTVYMEDHNHSPNDL